MPPPAMASPKKQPAPAPSSTPAPAALDSKHVVEAADLTPQAPETKVVPTTIPIPESLVISPDCHASHSVSLPSSDSTPQETPQSTEHNQPLAAEPVSEPIIHAQEKIPISESAAASIPAVEQQQDSSEKIAEDYVHTEIETSDADQQAQSVSISKIPAVQQAQNISEKATEQQDLSPLLKSEMQSLLTTDLDKATVPLEVEMEPNHKITQSEAAPILTDIEKVELTPEKPPEVTTDLVEPKPALTSEVTAQGIYIQSDPMTDPTSTNAKEEKITDVELGKPPEENQVDEARFTAADQTPPDKVDTAFNVEQTDIIPKLVTDSVTPNVKNDVSGLIKAEAIIERPALTEDIPHPQIEIVDNLSHVAPRHTEPILNMVNKSPPVAPVEVETKDQEKVNTIENNIFEKVFIEGDADKQNVLENVFEETMKSTTEKTNGKERVVEKGTIEDEARFEQKSSNGKAFEEEGVQNSAAADRMIKVKADNEKAFEEEELAQKTVENANDQKPLQQEGNKAESNAATSSTETLNVCPVIEMKKSETAGEPALNSKQEIPKEETQIRKKIGTNESSHPEENFVETVLLLEKLEEKEKPMVEVESVAQTEEEQTPIDTMLKAGDKSEKAGVMSASQHPDCEEQEKVNVKEPVQSLEIVSSSIVISKTQVGDSLTAVCQEKILQGEIQGSSQNTNSIAEDQHKVDKGMLALTDSNEKQLEKEEKLDKFVARNMQETISVSETCTIRDKKGTANFGVGENEVSKTDEVSETAFEIVGVSAPVVSVPVAEPEIPVFVDSEQDKSPSEKNTITGEEKDAKTHLLGKSSEDAVTEVTIVLGPSSGRFAWLFLYIIFFISPICTATTILKNNIHQDVPDH